jgi:hypothetical protein
VVVEQVTVQVVQVVQAVVVMVERLDLTDKLERQTQAAVVEQA